MPPRADRGPATPGGHESRLRRSSCLGGHESRLRAHHVLGDTNRGSAAHHVPYSASLSTLLVGQITLFSAPRKPRWSAARLCRRSIAPCPLWLFFACRSPLSPTR